MQSKMPLVNTPKFILRDLTIDDYLDYYFIGCDSFNTKYLTWGPFKNPLEARLMLEQYYLKRPLLNLPVGYAIELKKTNEVIGIIEYHTYFQNENMAELGFILRNDYHKKGIMSKALSIMLDLGFNYLNLDKVLVGHVDLNDDCKNLVLKMGFKYEYTKYGAFKLKDTLESRNIIYYTLYKKEYEEMKY